MIEILYNNEGIVYLSIYMYIIEHVLYNYITLAKYINYTSDLITYVKIVFE